ncbi:hypothetical protein EDB83DRAFT_2674123 [Lactarius deliciosus]|nr:hypothetical protein EDB83DRAFT_2674123 [Lactarius deliciosus]
MVWEELEQELDEGQNLDLDSDIGDEDGIIGWIQDFVDENDNILHPKDREQRNASSGPSTTTSSRSTSTTYRQFAETPHTSSLTAVPPAHPRAFCSYFIELKRDEYRLRELQRITGAVAVVDPFTPKKKRCDKKAHRATRQAAASVSLETVAGHIRRIMLDFGRAPTLSLPPTARHTRNSVLSGAHTFSLKSQSEGKNATRFTRLIETTLGDVWVDERNVAWVLAKPPHGEREGKAGRKIRPRDGKVVGGVHFHTKLTNR